MTGRAVGRRGHSGRDGAGLHECGGSGGGSGTGAAAGPRRGWRAARISLDRSNRKPWHGLRSERDKVRLCNTRGTSGSGQTSVRPHVTWGDWLGGQAGRLPVRTVGQVSAVLVASHDHLKITAKLYNHPGGAAEPG